MNGQEEKVSPEFKENIIRLFEEARREKQGKCRLIVSYSEEYLRAKKLLEDRDRQKEEEPWMLIKKLKGYMTRFTK